MIKRVGFGSEGFGDEILLGAWLTLQLAVCSLVFGLLLDLPAAAAKLSKFRAARFIAHAYTEVIRGAPEMLAVLVVFFGASAVLQKAMGLFGYEKYIEINAFLAGTTALGMDGVAQRCLFDIGHRSG